MPDWKPQIRQPLTALQPAPIRENAIVEELAPAWSPATQQLQSRSATPCRRRARDAGGIKCASFLIPSRVNFLRTAAFTEGMGALG